MSEQIPSANITRTRAGQDHYVSDIDETGLGAVDAVADEGAPSSMWGEDEWDTVLERYWAEHEWIGIDQRARALSLCSLNEAPTREDVLELAPAAVSSDVERAQVERIEAIADAVDQAGAGTFWLATQTLFDSEEDMDWRIVALVDVPASDEANRVALATITVGAR